MKFIFAVLILVLSLNTYSEDKSPVDEIVDESKNDLMVVIGGGIAGAVLGLSTLSFYDEPKKHTKNIVMGASLGIIAGVIFVAYNQAFKTKESVYSFMQDIEELKPKSFNTTARNTWHNNNLQHNSAEVVQPYLMNYNINF
jgi:hypothetical protein